MTQSARLGDSQARTLAANHLPRAAIRSLPGPVPLALLLGALSAAALPPFFFLPLLWVAVPGLIGLIGSAGGARQAGLRGWCFGFAHHLIGLYWITEAILQFGLTYAWAVPIAVPLLAAVLAVFIAVPCALAALARPGWRRLLVFAGAWMLADLARQFTLTGFPWNLWGADWAIPGFLGTLFLQPAAWIGVHGLTLATLLLAGLPSLGRGWREWRPWAGALAGLALWAGLGAFLQMRRAGPTPGLKVVIVQADVGVLTRWDRARALAIFRRYLALTTQSVAEAGAGRKIVVWPETASPFLLAADAPARAAVAKAAGPGVSVLAGTVRLNSRNQAFNSLVILTGAGQVGAVYDKWHLVPYGEYQPPWLPLPLYFGPGGFTPGPGPKVLRAPGVPRVTPLICYESIFTGEILPAGERPRWLVNVTNDAWFGTSAGPHQHLAAARLRAVEEGLPLVRAANTGISAVFDSFGRQTGRLGLGREGVLIRPLPAALPPTFYSRFGLWVPGLLGLVALTFGFSGVSFRDNRIKTKHEVPG